MPSNVVILGAGTGGTMLANMLARRARDASITVVGNGGEHVFQPANLDVAFRGEDPERFTRPEAPLLAGEIAFDPTGAERVDVARRVVRLRDGREIGYDALVWATGAVARPDALPGLAEGSLNFHTGPRNAAKIWRALRDFESGDIVVAIAGTPYKCPPSPVEALFLLDDLFRARGHRSDVRLRLVTPYPRAYPAANIADVVEPLFAERGIEVSNLFNAEGVDVAARRIYSLEGEEVPYDLLLAIPPHRGADVVVASGIGDEEGWIPADKETMRVPGQDAMWAIGDGTAIPISKSGVVAHLQAEVVARNIATQLAGEKGELAYEGRINCPMEVGRHRALFVSATYTSPPERQTPNMLRYAMKRTFGHTYWRAVRGDYDWVFDAYFGRTSHPKEAAQAA